MESARFSLLGFSAFLAVLYQNIRHFRESFSSSFSIRVIREIRGGPSHSLWLHSASVVYFLCRLWLRFLVQKSFLLR
jgi:hypothetical protein